MANQFLITIRQDQAQIIMEKGWTLSAIVNLQLEQLITHRDKAKCIIVDKSEKRRCPRPHRTTINLAGWKKHEIEFYEINLSATVRNLIDYLIENNKPPYNPIFNQP